MLMQEKKLSAFDDVSAQKPKSADALYKGRLRRSGHAAFDNKLKDEILRFTEEKRKMTLPGIVIII